MLRRRGFSLLEVMVAAGVLGVVTLGVVETMNYANRGARGVEEKFTRQTSFQNVLTILRDSRACQATFVRNNWAIDTGVTIDLDDILRSDGTVVIDKVNPIGGPGGSIRVTSIQLSQWEAIATNTYVYDSDGGGPIPPATWQYDDAVVSITYQKTLTGNHSSIGTDTFREQVPVRIVRNNSNTNRIVACSTGESIYMEAACNSLGGTLAEPPFCKDLNIEQLGGAASANRALTVRGFTRIDNSLGLGKDPTGAAASGNLDLSGGVGVGTSAATGAGNIDMSGNLTAIGNANISGGVGIGALVATGAGNLDMSGNARITGTLTVTNATTLNNTLTVAGVTTLNNNTNSVNKDSGALIVANGGVGVEGNIYAGGTLNNIGNTNITSGGGTVNINSNGANTTTIYGNSIIRDTMYNWGTILNPSYTSQISSVANVKEVATIGDVSKAIYLFLANGVTGSDREQIIQQLLLDATTTGAGVDALRDNYLGSVGAIPSCPGGQTISDINYNPIANTVSSVCSSPAKCNTPGSCSQVCVGLQCFTSYYVEYGSCEWVYTRNGDPYFHGSPTSNTNRIGYDIADWQWQSYRNPYNSGNPAVMRTNVKCKEGFTVRGVDLWSWQIDGAFRDSLGVLCCRGHLEGDPAGGF